MAGIPRNAILVLTAAISAVLAMGSANNTSTVLPSTSYTSSATTSGASYSTTVLTTVSTEASNDTTSAENATPTAPATRTSPLSVTKYHVLEMRLGSAFVVAPLNGAQTLESRTPEGKPLSYGTEMVLYFVQIERSADAKGVGPRPMGVERPMGYNYSGMFYMAYGYNYLIDGARGAKMYAPVVIFRATYDNETESPVMEVSDTGRYTGVVSNERNGNATRFSLTVGKVTGADEGVYVWSYFSVPYVANDANRHRNLSAVELLARSKVWLHAYKRPSKISVTAKPVVAGERYVASCLVTDYYPPWSVRFEWKSDQVKIDESSYNTIYTYGQSGTRSMLSTLTLYESGDNRQAPTVRCSVTVEIERSSNGTEANTAVVTRDFSETPIRYIIPTVKTRVDDEGDVVCDAYCVPPDTVSISWVVDGRIVDDAPSIGGLMADGSSSTKQYGVTSTGQCDSHPGLINIQSKRGLSEVDGVVKYTCRLTGYPTGIPTFEDMMSYDASPSIAGMPIVAAVMGTLVAGSILGSLVIITALCLYYSKDDGL